MEGVGGRLGRTSSRYGPTTVFTGPVRRWKKKWTHITASSTNNNSTPNTSHLLLFKWTPLNCNNGDKGSKEDDVSGDHPPKRKFKYVPVAVLEEQKLEASEQLEDETLETDTNVEPTSNSDELDEKPDINDVPMEECQGVESKQEERQDLNESLDLNSEDGENNFQSKQIK
ncbi:hypothetical protein Leryth_019666 [Lithospermum erythrorhizon]|nr:hypothetical protein Leryth_019666 [Lithospermum erythrorhizon]